MRQLPVLACLAGGLSLAAASTLQAQTIDPKAAAAEVAGQLQDQVTGTVTSQGAPNAVPGYGGADLPQGNYMARPDLLANDGAIQATTSEPYAIVTNPNRATVDPTTLGLANARTVEASPSAYSGGTGAGGSQGNCQQLPPSPGTSSTYYDSCQIGAAEQDQTVSCKIAWNDAFTMSHRYTCHSLTLYGQSYRVWHYSTPTLGDPIVLGNVTDCGDLATSTDCTPVSSAATDHIDPPSPFTRAYSPYVWAWNINNPIVIENLSLNLSDSFYANETDQTFSCGQAHTLQPQQSTTVQLRIFFGRTAGSEINNWTVTAPGAVDNGGSSTYTGSSIDNSDCANKIKGLTCMPPQQVCVDSAPATRTVNGVAVTHDCWQWQATYQCGTLSSASDCASLQAKNNCSFDHEVCLDDPQNGPCQVKSEVYKCTTPAVSGPSPAYACSGDVYCLNGSCTQLPRSASPDLAKALVAINAMGDATKQFDTANLSIFDGQATGCHKPLFGLVNCCAGKVSGLLTGASAATAMAGLLTGNYAFLLGMVTQFLPLLMCSQEEMLLDVKDRLGLCHYVGEYCSQKALFICTTERKAYCCYQSKLARVIQEQGRAQLGLDFGAPQGPNCSGFTVDQFSKLDLSKMDFSEVFADFTSAVSLPSSLQTSSEIQQKVQAYYQTRGARTAP